MSKETDMVGGLQMTQRPGDSLEDAIEQARAGFSEEDFSRAWELLSAHRAELDTEPRLKALWNELIHRATQPGTPEEMDALLDAWSGNLAIVLGMDEVVMRTVQREATADPARAQQLAGWMATGLERCMGSLEEPARSDPDLRAALQASLATTLCMAGPARDAEALQAYRELLAMTPDSASQWFNLGLLHKQRGRFAEGVDVNRRALEVGGFDVGVLWNLAICATGARDGSSALKAWSELGYEVTLGEDGLPSVEGLDRVQVQVSTGAMPGTDTPATETPHFEHVWVERLSPCHGRVVTPTLLEASADYGDLVLFDGQPIGYLMDGDRQLPRLPQIALLERGSERCFRFAALQPALGTVERLTAALPEGCFIYAYSERVRWLCLECVRGTKGHVHCFEEDPYPRRVYGKLVVPGCLELTQIYRQLDRALAGATEVRLACPALHQALGDELGTRRARRTWAEIEAATG